MPWLVPWVVLAAAGAAGVELVAVSGDEEVASKAMAKATGNMAGNGTNTTNGTGYYVPPDSNLVPSLLLDLGVLVLGCLFYWAIESCGVSQGRHDPTDRDRLSTAARNYIRVLRACQESFMLQTFISSLAVMPLWGSGPLSFGLDGNVANVLGTLDPTGLTTMCVETALRGAAALWLVERLRVRIEQPRTVQKRIIRRTMWITGLPTYDSCTGEQFIFEGDEEIEQVANDLREVIEASLHRTTVYARRRSVSELAPRPIEINVEVAPVLERYQHLTEEYRDAAERAEAYTKWMNQMPMAGPLDFWLWHYYGRKEAKWSARIHELQDEILSTVEEPKCLSGSVFVTFEDPRHRDHFLQEKPTCLQCRQHTFFSFGRKPFASVTLACCRAPPPSDINWLNLHITPRQQFWRGAGLSFLLFLMMVAIVTPVTVGSQLQVIIAVLRKRIQLLSNYTHLRHWVQSVDIWDVVTNQLPAFILLFLNSLILPELNRRIAIAVRAHLKSTTEVIELHLNYVFLILNALVIPFFGLGGVSIFVEWGERTSHKSKKVVTREEIVGNVATILMQSSGAFALKYILNCACVTNVHALLQVPQFVYKSVSRRLAITARDRMEAEEQFEFGWGYAYSWILSIFTVGVLLSTVVPSMLPATAILFLMQHWVDRRNLTRGVYKHGPDFENYFISRALHYMRGALALWWLIMGSAFMYLFKRELPSGVVWDAFIAREKALYISLGMALIGLLVFVWSWWDLLNMLHDSAFQVVDVAKRGLYNTLLQRFLDCITRGGYSRLSGNDGQGNEDWDSDPEAAKLPIDAEPIPGAVDITWDARRAVLPITAPV